MPQTVVAKPSDQESNKGWEWEERQEKLNDKTISSWNILSKNLIVELLTLILDFVKACVDAVPSSKL